MPEKEITFEGILPDSEAHIKRLGKNFLLISNVKALTLVSNLL